MITDMKQDIYEPSAEIRENAIVQHPEELTRQAAENLAGFWEEQARQFTWFTPWTKVLDNSNKPFYKWFVGATTNIVYNCLDRHVATWRRNKLALIWESEKGDVRTFSYHALNREVCMFANVLRSMGVKKGDRVTIYMGRIPETADCHAGLRQDRRRAFRGLRRIFGRGPARAYRGQPIQYRDHLRRRLHER